MLEKTKISKDFLKKIKKYSFFKDIDFIFLFGSVAKGTSTPLSDIDICISLPKLTKLQRGKIRIKLLANFEEIYDIQIFEALPLFIQKEVFKGEIIFCKSKDKLIQKAIDKIPVFEEFERYYNYYITRNEAEAILWKEK